MRPKTSRFLASLALFLALALFNSVVCRGADADRSPSADPAKARPAAKAPRPGPGKFSLPDTSDASRGLDLSRVALDLVYEADFSKPLRVARETDLFEGERRVRRPEGVDWVLEGSTAKAWTEGGQLRMSNGQHHLVLWNTREFPGDFLLEFQMAPQKSDRGLAIVFFNAHGREGGDIFDLAQPLRDGDFKMYHTGGLNCYHASYWSGERAVAHIRKNHGFHLVAQGQDFISGSGPGPHRVRILKLGAKIQIECAGKLAVQWEDNDASRGAVRGAGAIGLRQMVHTGECAYSSFKVWAAKAK